MSETNLIDEFDVIDEAIETLESDQQNNRKSLDQLLSKASILCARLLTLYASAYDKTLPDNEDLLVLFKAFVKGDTSLTAVRDNVRELVYYRNCILEDRHDALPKQPEKMTVHTIRHIYLYLRSRADQEGLLD